MDQQALAEYRYRAVREVLEGSPIGEVAQRYGTSRQSLDAWRKRFLAEGMPGLTDRSRRPKSSPARMPAELEALVCQLRREHPRWGARRFGVPSEVLTDNGKQFTGRHMRPQPVEVLFERVCRENGISQRLTKPRSPTTTGKIERFHKTLRAELLDSVLPFESIEAAQDAIDG